MNDTVKRDLRPEGSALLQSLLLGEWYKAMHLGICAASDGNVTKIEKVTRKGTAGYQFHVITIKESTNV